MSTTTLWTAPGAALRAAPSRTPALAPASAPAAAPRGCRPRRAWPRSFLGGLALWIATTVVTPATWNGNLVPPSSCWAASWSRSASSLTRHAQGGHAHAGPVGRPGLSRPVRPGRLPVSNRPAGWSPSASAWPGLSSASPTPFQPPDAAAPPDAGESVADLATSFLGVTARQSRGHLQLSRPVAGPETGARRPEPNRGQSRHRHAGARGCSAVSAQMRSTGLARRPVLVRHR
jgi:hypothetical protein